MNEATTHPGPAREGSRVVVHGICALHVADSKHARSHVGRESPISNGLTTVAVEHLAMTHSKKKVSTNVGRILDDCLDGFIMVKFDM